MGRRKGWKEGKTEKGRVRLGKGTLKGNGGLKGREGEAVRKFY